jgi:hypothetical protein
VGAVGDSRLLRLLLLQLHQGEAEAIAFATELKADMVLIDEQEGRQLASRTGFDLLRSKAHFFIAAPLESKDTQRRQRVAAGSLGRRKYPPQYLSA